MLTSVLMNTIIALLMIAGPAFAQFDDFAGGFEPAPSAAPAAARDPSALTLQPRKRTYPGGSDEEDLRVMAALPEAEIRTDARTLQRDVYKTVYNQELKEERHDDAEE